MEERRIEDKERRKKIITSYAEKEKKEGKMKSDKGRK